MNALSILETVLGPSKKSSSDEYLFYCPFCYHHKPKLSINMGKHKGFWKCWFCGAHGRRINNLLYKMGIPKAERHEILFEFDDSLDIVVLEEEDESQLILPTEYHPIWQPIDSYEYQNASHFLKMRGLTRSDIIKHQIGYCESGKFKGHVIIPSYDAKGDLNYFVSRVYYDTDSDYKYINPPANKSRVILFENMIDWNQPVVLVEGVFDAISVRRNAIPLLGKVITTELRKRLIEKRPPMIYVMLDQDAQAEAILMETTLNSKGLNVEFVPMEEKDASEMGFARSWELIAKSKRSSFKDLICSKME